MKFFKIARKFHEAEDGAVTVDWVVLTAAVVGLGVVALPLLWTWLFAEATTRPAVDLVEAGRGRLAHEHAAQRPQELALALHRLAGDRHVIPGVQVLLDHRGDLRGPLRAKRPPATGGAMLPSLGACSEPGGGASGELSMRDVGAVSICGGVAG